MDYGKKPRRAGGRLSAVDLRLCWGESFFPFPAPIILSAISSTPLPVCSLSLFQSLSLFPSPSLSFPLSPSLSLSLSLFPSLSLSLSFPLSPSLSLFTPLFLCLSSSFPRNDYWDVGFLVVIGFQKPLLSLSLPLSLFVHLILSLSLSLSPSFFFCHTVSLSLSLGALRRCGISPLSGRLLLFSSD